MRWQCDSCGDVRDDAYIDTLTYRIPGTHHLIRNRKYCNDRIACEEKAEEAKRNGIF